MLAATRSGWLSMFIAATLVPGPGELLPILVLAVLPAWLLTKGRAKPGPWPGPLDAVA